MPQQQKAWISVWDLKACTPMPVTSVCEKNVWVNATGWDLSEDTVALMHGNKGEADVHEDQHIHMGCWFERLLSAFEASV